MQKTTSYWLRDEVEADRFSQATTTSQPFVHWPYQQRVIACCFREWCCLFGIELTKSNFRLEVLTVQAFVFKPHWLFYFLKLAQEDQVRRSGWSLSYLSMCFRSLTAVMEYVRSITLNYRVHYIVAKISLMNVGMVWFLLRKFQFPQWMEFLGCFSALAS